jgi:cytochrome c551/c552
MPAQAALPDADATKLAKWILAVAVAIAAAKAPAMKPRLPA